MMAHRHAIDAAFVLESAEEDFATAQTISRVGIPAVVRIDHRVLAQLSPAKLKTLQNLFSGKVAFVTPDEFGLAALEGQATLSAATRCIELVPDGVSEPATASPDKRGAREVLARTHPIFQLESGALLAVCAAELTFESGVFALVRSWRRVLAAHPTARLWLLGSGQNTPELFQRICDLEMQHSVLITGNFDDVSDVLQAADALILPGIDDRPDWFLNSALGQRVTIIHHQRAPAVSVMQESARHIPFDDDSRPIDLVVNRWANATAKRGPNGLLTEQPGVTAPANAWSLSQMAQQYLALVQGIRARTEKAHK